jgi:dolichyl-phosphate beta-glucosyltransferase
MISRPEISIIVPALNEELRLPKTLESIHTYLMTRGLHAEVLVVDDGSTDNTAKIVKDFSSRFPELRLISNGRNRGKGFSVRHGMLEACGEIALFTDADLSAPIEEADKLLSALREDHYDGAIGSRALDRGLIQVHQSPFREQAGIIFNGFVRLVLAIPFADTQCGFKAFRRERMRILFEQQQTEGFGFDPEILFLARRYGLRVAEIPVRWAHSPASKVNVLTDSIRMFTDLLAIRWNAVRGRYSSDETVKR